MSEIPNHDNRVAGSPPEVGMTEEDIESALRDVSPCPGCGSRKHVSIVENEFGFYVNCEHDGWNGPRQTYIGECIDAWNRRATVRIGK